MKWKKKEKETKPNKVKKVRTMKVGTHKKSVIALWLVLIASVSFGVYKNFTAIDMHTVHEKKIIEERIVDTNKIENFVKDFAKAYYTWSNTKEAIDARTAAISGYLTESLQDLNVDTVRSDIPTSSAVGEVKIWNIEQTSEDEYTVLYCRSDGDGGRTGDRKHRRLYGNCSCGQQRRYGYHQKSDYQQPAGEIRLYAKSTGSGRLGRRCHHSGSDRIFGNILQAVSYRHR